MCFEEYDRSDPTACFVPNRSHARANKSTPSVRCRQRDISSWFGIRIIGDWKGNNCYWYNTTVVATTRVSVPCTTSRRKLNTSYRNISPWLCSVCAMCQDSCKTVLDPGLWGRSMLVTNLKLSLHPTAVVASSAQGDHVKNPIQYCITPREVDSDSE